MIHAGGAACGALCGVGEACLHTRANPNFGAVGFDDIFEAIASIFMSMSLEGWSELMHWLAVPQPEAAPLYFILLVMFGAFFVFNLYAVIISEARAKPPRRGARRPPIARATPPALSPALQPSPETPPAVGGRLHALWGVGTGHRVSLCACRRPPVPHGCTVVS